LDFKREIHACCLILKDPRTPRPARWLLAAAVGYTLAPFDLAPGFIPVIGHIDDVIIVPLSVYPAVKMIPQNVMGECHKEAKSQK
jgi:uncharacterized membrane protein YkvA (DUF1232 family)